MQFSVAQKMVNIDQTGGVLRLGGYGKSFERSGQKGVVTIPWHRQSATARVAIPQPLQPYVGVVIENHWQL